MRRKVNEQLLDSVSTCSDYYPGGMLMPNRNASSDSYRYSFNGKERDDEVKGNGNHLDFGARAYDNRLMRWMSTDPQFDRYPAWSPYHFGYNNPIITIDPNGEENIIVIGGVDLHGDREKFINSGLKQFNDFISLQDKEQTTIALVTAFMTKEEIQEVRNKVIALKEAGQNVSIVEVTSGQELTNYFNSKSTKKAGISKERSNDKVTDVAFFGHGLANHRKDGPSFEPGWYGPNGDSDKDKYKWGMSDINLLDPEAFLNPCWYFYSCNSATDNKKGDNMVKEVSAKTKGVALGYEGKTDFVNIYDAAWGITWYTFVNGRINASDKYPTGGWKDRKKNIEKSELKKYDKGERTKL